MLPFNELSSVSAGSEYLSPDDERVAPLIAKELGGIALSDPSQGLQVQEWTARYRDGNVVVEAPSVSESVLFAREGITEIDLAFDQNMFAAVAFTQVEDETQSGWLWWFSTLDNQHIFTEIAGAYDLRVTMDDKRSLSSGQNDIILTYLKDNNLYFRAQRDRFGVEYLLRENINGRLRRFGMNDGLRLQWEILLDEQHPDLVLVVPADDDYVSEADILTISADDAYQAPADAGIEVLDDNWFLVPADNTLTIPSEDDPCP